MQFYPKHQPYDNIDNTRPKTNIEPEHTSTHLEKEYIYKPPIFVVSCQFFPAGSPKNHS